MWIGTPEEATFLTVMGNAVEHKFVVMGLISEKLLLWIVMLLKLIALAAV
jgi:hypothetical protein